MRVIVVPVVEIQKVPFERIVQGEIFWMDDGEKTPARVRIRLSASVYAPVYGSSAPLSTYAGKSFELVSKGTKIVLVVE